MTINPLTLSYPDFKEQTIIDPEEFDTNNGDIKRKIDEIINVVNLNDLNQQAEALRIPTGLTRLLDLKVPGFYYFSTEESLILTDHPKKGVAGWWLNIFKHPTLENNVYQEIIRNSQATPEKFWRIVSSTNTVTSWQIDHSTSRKNDEYLWRGALYPRATDVARPSKKLSECRNGWLIVWSDYDYGKGSNNFHWHTTPIPRYMGSNHSGNSHIVTVPTGFNDTTLTITGKYLYIYNDRIVGHDSNTKSANHSNDAVMRYILEY